MMVAEILALVGAVLILFSAVGVTRFRDVMAQLHFLSKATTLGIVVVFLGAALGIGDVNGATSLVLAALLQMLTAPVSSNLISRSTYLRERRSSGEATEDVPGHIS